MAENEGHLLVTDDDRGFRVMICEFLMRRGYTVDVATDGFEAVQLAEENDYDLILMDISMPRFNGVEAIRAIKRKTPEAKILVVTAYLMGEVAEEIAGAGADRALAKPVGLEELGEAIAELIG